MEQGLLANFRNTVDKKINAIVYEAPHCAYYQLNGTWQKSELQGPLFIVHRMEYPTYSLIILSKHKLTHFAQAITADVEFEKASSQLLAVRDQHSKIHGFWFPMPEHLTQCYDNVIEIQRIDKQTKNLKDMLDLGKDDPVLITSSPEFIPEEMGVLKPEFFSRGIQFEEDAEEKEMLRDTVISLANSEEFIELVVQGLESRGFSFSKLA